MKKSLIALAFGTLALGMSEFVMMGILPDIARSLGVTIPRAGHLISAYALGVCFGAPLTVLVARTRPLKQILLVLTALTGRCWPCVSFRDFPTVRFSAWGRLSRSGSPMRASAPRPFRL